MVEKWYQDRRTEQDLESEVSAFSRKKEKEQALERRKTIENLQSKGVCGHDINFGILNQFLKTPAKERTPEDTKQFKFTIENLSNAFGERYIASMYREWQRTPKETPQL